MFNFDFIVFVGFWFLFYTVQTVTFIILITVFKSKTSVLDSNPKLALFNTNFNYFIYLIIMSYAGLPPFFMFFFKIMVVLNLDMSYWSLFAYLTINTAILFYYTNFILQIQQNKEYRHEPTKLVWVFQITNFLLYLIFINLVGFLFFEYFNFIF